MYRKHCACKYLSLASKSQLSWPAALVSTASVSSDLCWWCDSSLVCAKSLQNIGNTTTWLTYSTVSKTTLSLMISTLIPGHSNSTTASPVLSACWERWLAWPPSTLETQSGLLNSVKSIFVKSQDLFVCFSCEFQGISLDVAEDYCWIHGSTFIPREYQPHLKCIVEQEYFQDSDDAPDTAYYQWVSFFMVLQVDIEIIWLF